MSKKPAASRLPSDYAAWLASVKDRVRSAQLKAATRVNRELISLYWDIGLTILHHQQKEGWGTKVIERLAADLKSEFPEMAGFSRTNFLNMRAFVAAWAETPIVQQAVGLLATAARRPRKHAIVQQPVGLLTPGPAEPLASLPWGHHLVLLHKLKSREARLWYARAAVQHGWSRSILALQIEHRAHARAGKAVSNFAAALAPLQSDLAQQTLKDPYIFDFLTLDSAARERELEQGLIDHIQKFLVALGTGFAFVGRQVHLEISGDDYYLDLLFYHLKLRCYVVIDLKVEAFKPEFTGKMNFYLSAVDDQMRHRDDQPTLGLLLCKEHNRLKVEYALRDVKKPIGVAAWRTRLVDSLPKKLQSSLPTVEEIEQELGSSRPGNRKNRPSHPRAPDSLSARE